MLHAMLPLPLSTALLGGRVEVPTLTGRAMLHVPPCARNGQVLTLVDSNGHTAASASVSQGSATSSAPRPATPLLFHVLVIIPRSDALSGRQREALSHFDRATDVGDGGRVPLQATDSAATTTTTTAASDATVEQGVGGIASESSISTREDLMAACAVLKRDFKHWITPP